MHTIAAAALLATAHALQLPWKPAAVAAPPSAPAAIAADDHRRAVIGGHNWLTHAPPSYFVRDKLTVKGPRANTDVGAPVDATRPLVKLGDVAVGSWSCSEGGWLSPAPRTSTEWFIMLEGEGSVDEEDGTRHRFAAGDVVVLPRGWSGRWDVQKDLHKVWAVHTHPDDGRSTSPVIATPSQMSDGDIYKAGDTAVRVWTRQPGPVEIRGKAATESIYVLSGEMFVTNQDGSAVRCVAGDTVALPRGWTGRYDVASAVKAVSVVVGQETTSAAAPAPSHAGGKRRPIVGGKWKCNPATASSLDELCRNFDGVAPYLDKCDVYVCPSNLHVALVKDNFTPGIHVAPQNCNFKGCGAYTGEMSVDQIQDLGLGWVLIGHSERRGEFGLPTPAESNQLMATKLQYILDQGLNCVFCIGEPLSIRQKGIQAVLAECADQLTDIVPILRALQDKSRVVIAYEPVWAIGTGEAATPEQAQETHKGIREWIAANVDSATAEAIRIQYGGSANAGNAPELSSFPDIDGFLVGGASLKPEIADIVKAIAEAK